MIKDITSTQFVKTLTECVKEYKKLQNDCRDDNDVAHFFNASLKKFLIVHKDSIILLSSLNFERPFVSWLKSYVYDRTKF